MKCLLFVAALLIAPSNLMSCDKSISDAVLNLLYPRFGSTSNYLSVWLSRNYEEAHWNPILAAEEAEIQKVQKWALSSHELDECVRDEYMHWTRYFMDEIASARRELKTHKTQIEQDAYEKRMKDSRNAMARHKIPEPPR